MNGLFVIPLIVIAICCATYPAWSVTPSADELATAHQWAQTKFAGARQTERVHCTGLS